MIKKYMEKGKIILKKNNTNCPNKNGRKNNTGDAAYFNNKNHSEKDFDWSKSILSSKIERISIERSK